MIALALGAALATAALAWRLRRFDFAWAVRPTSRLACQINLSDDLGTLTVQMPGGAYNLDR